MAHGVTRYPSYLVLVGTTLVFRLFLRSNTHNEELPGVGTCPDIHQPTFAVDERCIGVGLTVLAELATTGQRAKPESSVTAE